MAESHEQLRRIRKSELISVMLADKEGWLKAVDLVLIDKTDVFFAKNPKADFKEEFNQLLLKKEQRSTQEEQQLNELLNKMKLFSSFLRQEILKTYANMNGYSIVEEG